MRSKDIVIAGSGLVGALFSRVLAERGHRVRLFERRPDLRKVTQSAGRSINLALSDRGFRALASVGLEEALRALSIPMRGRRIHAKDGTLTYQPYGREGQAIHSVSRAGLNGLLMDHAEAHGNVEVLFDHRCVDIDLAAPALVVERGTDGARARVEAECVFGADGAFSAVRRAMMARPRFDFSQAYEAHGYKELTIPAAEGVGDERFRLDPGALHIWPRGGFMLIALPNLDGSFTVTLFLPYGGEAGFESLTDPTAVERFFAREFPDAMALMPGLVEEFFTNPTGDLVTMRCAPWYVEDRVCLIGDAAHAIVPFYGQGMNAGFEDCRIFGELHDTIASEMGAEDEAWARLLQRFGDCRKPDADAIAELARMNFIEMRDRVADPRFLLRKQIEARIQELFADAYLPLYSMVTFSHLPYSEALARGREHDAMMEQLLAIPGIEHAWQGPGGDRLLRDAVAGSGAGRGFARTREAG